MATAYYPNELAHALRERWAPAGGGSPLPEHAVLTQFLSIVYQASLLREEARYSGMSEPWIRETSKSYTSAWIEPAFLKNRLSSV